MRKPLGEHSEAIIKKLVEDCLKSKDEMFLLHCSAGIGRTGTLGALIEAMRFAAARMKMVVEPTGALAMAAAMQGAVDVRGKRVGVVISGGNIDIAQFAQYLA
jgi:protein tyrosine phosphatase